MWLRIGHDTQMCSIYIMTVAMLATARHTADPTCLDSMLTSSSSSSSSSVVPPLWLGGKARFAWLCGASGVLAFFVQPFERGLRFNTGILAAGFVGRTLASCISTCFSTLTTGQQSLRQSSRQYLRQSSSQSLHESLHESLRKCAQFALNSGIGGVAASVLAATIAHRKLAAWRDAYVALDSEQAILPGSARLCSTGDSAHGSTGLCSTGLCSTSNSRSWFMARRSFEKRVLRAAQTGRVDQLRRILLVRRAFFALDQFLQLRTIPSFAREREFRAERVRRQRHDMYVVQRAIRVAICNNFPETVQVLLGSLRRMWRHEFARDYAGTITALWVHYVVGDAAYWHKVDLLSYAVVFCSGLETAQRTAQRTRNLTVRRTRTRNRAPAFWHVRLDDAGPEPPLPAVHVDPVVPNAQHVGPQHIVPLQMPMLDVLFAEVDGHGINSALMTAVCMRKCCVVQHLLRLKAQVNATFQYRTDFAFATVASLHLAVFTNDAAVCRVLLQHGADAHALHDYFHFVRHYARPHSLWVWNESTRDALQVADLAPRIQVQVPAQGPAQGPEQGPEQARARKLGYRTPLAWAVWHGSWSAERVIRAFLDRQTS
jgi:hypothetical protein